MSNSTFSDQREAVNSFVGKAIESNLLTTVKSLIAAFPNDVDFNSHEVSISFYSVYRGDNPDMMSFLFEKGAELEYHQLSQVVEESPIETFKVIFKHYRQWFERRRNNGDSIQVKALFKDRHELIPFLADEGFELNSDSLPLKDMIDRWAFHDSHIYAFAFSNIIYTMDDFNALDAEHQKRFISRLAAGKEGVVSAIANSSLGGTLDIPELQDHALKNNNAILISAILERGNSINADISCDATEFLDDSRSFAIAIQRDLLAKKLFQGDRDDFYVNRLIGLVFRTPCVKTFDLAVQHIARLAQLKQGEAVDASVKAIVDKAILHIKDREVLNAFFGILPNHLFADNDMIDSAVLGSIPENNVVPFLQQAESKGLVLDATFFDSCLTHLARSRFTYKQELERFENITYFLCFARDRLGERAYKLMLDKTDYFSKSEKQILSGFRKAYYSDNISHKSTIIMMLLILASDSQRLSYLEAMIKVDDLKSDIAFTEVMRLWNMNPVDLLTLPISDKLKSSMVSALSD